MATDGNPQLDPRFDPAFQRGFDQRGFEADRADERGPDERGSSTTPPTIRRRDARVAAAGMPVADRPTPPSSVSYGLLPVAPTPVGAAAGHPIERSIEADAAPVDDSRAGSRGAARGEADALDDPDAEPVISASVNPFFIALWLIAGALIVAGVSMLRTVITMTATNAGTISTDYATLQFLLLASPLAIALGVATIIGQLFVLAIRRRKRAR
jgi:hypothetical protein